ncbi:hypothetical protein RAS1_32490 [Phycisphaerae bacterium RAS1]|nr:hypothetical protein RAS1_32490 [Phycisphaerae bacterium RAS1]
MKKLMQMLLALGLMAAVLKPAFADEKKDGAPAPAGAPPAAQPAQPAPAPTPGTPPAPSAPTGGKGKLELSNNVWDFGDVWQGDAVQGEIGVKNTGEGPLMIDVRSSCGCTVATKPKSPLAPGESDKLVISYNTQKRKGPANQTVTLTTDDPAQPSVPVTVKGTVKELVIMEPAEGVSFGRLLETSTEKRTVKIRPQYKEPMTLKLKEGADFGHYKVDFKEVKAGEEYELTVETVPPLKEGAGARIEIALETSLEKHKNVSIPVQAFIQEPVQVRPTRVFVPKNVSNPVTRLIRVSYTPENPIKIVDVKSNNDAIKVSIVPPKTGAANTQIAYHEIQVTLPPSDQIPAKGAQIEITTDAKDARYQKFTIPVDVVERPAAAGAPQVTPSPQIKMVPATPANTGATAPPSPGSGAKGDEGNTGMTPKDAPKGDAPKSDAPKGDAPKGDAPKGDAPKPAEPKSDPGKKPGK